MTVTDLELLMNSDHLAIQQRMTLALASVDHRRHSFCAYPSATNVRSVPSLIVSVSSVRAILSDRIRESTSIDR